MIALFLLAGLLRGDSCLVNGKPGDGVIWLVLPGDSIDLGLGFSIPDSDSVVWWCSRGEIKAKDSLTAVWRAPKKPGPCWIGCDRIPDSVFAWVMFPLDSLDKNGKIHGYPIGHYLDPKGKKASAMIKQHWQEYLPPPGLIEVPESLAGLHISRRFTVGQFVCPQPDTWPRFMYIDRDQIRLLEELADSLGVPGFTVVSGYRSPWYNRKRGRGKWSRHQYGDATDIMIDLDHDWYFDDVNKDNKIDVQDVFVIADAVQKLKKKWGNVIGMGMYFWGHKGVRTPFIHVDTRGFESWWNKPEWKSRLLARDEDGLLVSDTGSFIGNLVANSVGLMLSLPEEKHAEPRDTVPEPTIPKIGKGWRILVSPAKNAVFAFPDSGARKWEVRMYNAKGKRLWRYKQMLWVRSKPDNKPPEAVAFSPDGQNLALFHGKTLYLFSVQKGLMWHKTLTRPMWKDTASIEFNPKGDLVYLSKSGRLYCFDVPNYQLVWVRSGDYRDIKLTDNGELAGLNRQGSLDFIDPSTGKKTGQFNYYGLGYRGHNCVDIQTLSGGRVALRFEPLDPDNAKAFYYMLQIQEK